MLVSTQGTHVLTSKLTNTDNLAPCDHERADTRIHLHLQDYALKGHTAVMIYTVDTDVAILAVATVSRIPVKEAWKAFGTGTHFRYISGHGIAESLRKEV